MTEQLQHEAASRAIPAVDQRPAYRRGPQRPTRFDRPPEPRDWRFFVGGTGRLLIIVGLLLFGFIIYQLWGTGIQTARAQNRLEDRFAAAVAAAAAQPDVTTASTPPPTSTLPTSPTTPTTVNTPPATNTAPSVATAPPTSVAAVVQDIPPIRRNEPLARLEIPKIGKDLIVVPGVDPDDLEDGPGHYPDTPLPGQLGNAAIAGHRTTFGEPFRQIDELVPGDEIIVTMITGERFVYLVTGSEIVAPTEYRVVGTRDPNVAELTLTSCDPEFTATNRIVVYAVLDPQQSGPVGQPTFYELDDAPALTLAPPSPNDTTAPGSTAPGSTAPSGSVPGDEETSIGSSDPITDADPPAPQAGEPSEAVGDAFAQGWFDDPAAWPHVVGWGALCMLIAWLYRRISRYFRRGLVGLVTCVVPFAIVLYFFYQNVNRLLPPGL